MLTGHWCFSPKAVGTTSAEDQHLASMVALTGETFSESMLERGTPR
jgi:hypothetical protein